MYCYKWNLVVVNVILILRTARTWAVVSQVWLLIRKCGLWMILLCCKHLYFSGSSQACLIRAPHFQNVYRYKCLINCKNIKKYDIGAIIAVAFNDELLFFFFVLNLSTKRTFYWDRQCHLLRLLQYLILIHELGGFSWPKL